MKFEDFIKEGKVRRASKDPALIKSLISAVKNDLLVLEKFKIDDNTKNIAMTNYYEVLRKTIEAIAISEGYKVYSHEAFTFFLKEKKDPIVAEKFDRFRIIRNRINYEGKTISKEESIENVSEIKKIIEALKKKYLE
ncbi:MAG: hypothetical protein HYS32_02535 [Candidatus Woesearchaeota archaeon]|nr:MAG: hypothetical protein HYS32_02535 [Candidatus Woesearchaeota archaeon]